jgi:hypothetical protein
MNPIEKDEPASTATPAIDPKAASAGETALWRVFLCPTRL